MTSRQYLDVCTKNTLELTYIRGNSVSTLVDGIYLPEKAGNCPLRPGIDEFVSVAGNGTGQVEQSIQ